MEHFTPIQILKAVKLERQRLRKWVEEGFVQPSIPAEGQGKAALFSRSDIYRIALLRDLITLGYTRLSAALLVNSIPNDRLLSDRSIRFTWRRAKIQQLTDSRTGKSRVADRTIMVPVVARTGGDFAFEIDLQNLRKEVDLAIG
jgi:hypothetical protein